MLVLRSTHSTLNVVIGVVSDEQVSEILTLCSAALTISEISVWDARMRNTGDLVRLELT